MRFYLCPFVSGDFTLKADPSDGVWQKSAWSEDFLDIQGPSLPAPRHRTRFKAAWNSKGIAFLAELEEPHVWATLTEHDSVIFRDNDFELFLDPDGDSHNYLEFEINAFGTTWDLLLPRPYRAGGPALDGYEVQGMKSAVRVEGTVNDPSDKDKGWWVEMFIPWEGLEDYSGTRLPPQKGDQWRINFSRVQWLTDIVEGKYVKRPNQPEDNWVWSPQGFIDMHQPERWGVMQFALEPDEAILPLQGAAARETLFLFWKAQEAYRRDKKTWAASLGELGGTWPTELIFEGGHKAWSAELEGWVIDQTSRTWRT